MMVSRDMGTSSRLHLTKQSCAMSPRSVSLRASSLFCSVMLELLQLCSSYNENYNGIMPSNQGTLH